MNKNLYLTLAIMAILILTGVSCTKAEPTPEPTATPTETAETLPLAPAGQDEPVAAEQPIVEPTLVIEEPAGTPSEEPKVEPFPEPAVAANCDALGNNLSACSKYKCQFLHPFTGTPMIREVAGVVNGECQYLEQMPNGGKLKYNYTTAERKTAGQFYIDSFAAEKSGASMDGKTYTVNGQTVENPLQSFTDNGTCAVSGY